jgi:hypothetical protein
MTFITKRVPGFPWIFEAALILCVAKKWINFCKQTFPGEKLGARNRLWFGLCCVSNGFCVGSLVASMAVLRCWELLRGRVSVEVLGSSGDLPLEKIQAVLWGL